MNPYQEPKYDIRGGKLVNRQSGQPIPDDEPVFILRARDRRAAQAIQHYAIACNGNPDHFQAIAMRLAQFSNWATEHPERMKEPDTDMTKDWTDRGMPY